MNTGEYEKKAEKHRRGYMLPLLVILLLSLVITLTLYWGK